MANGNVTIYLGTEMEQRLKRLAEAERRSLTQQIVLMLEQHMNHKDNHEECRALRDEILAAINGLKAGV